MDQELYDIAVIGGGFAGMTAAMYARRAGKQTVILEAEAFGGQIISSAEVENYPGVPSIGGADLAQAAEDQLDALGVTKKSARATALRTDGDGFCVETDGAGEVRAKKIILALGVRHRKLEIPGEERLTGRGISWCATCDGNFFRGKDVAVAGGGNTAVQEAIHLSDLCQTVYLIHRRDTLRAETWLTKKMREKKNIQFLPNTVIEEAVGETRLEGLRLKNVRTNEQTQLNVSGLFEAVGMLPQNEMVSGMIRLDEHGYIVAGEDCRTNVPGIYAAGDCRAKSLRQLVSASADGATSAMNAVNDLM